MAVTWNKNKRQYQYSFNFQNKRYRKTNSEWIRGFKDLAIQAEEDAKEKLKYGFEIKHNIRFDELTELYLKYIANGKDELSTIRTKRRDIKLHISPFFESMPVKNISVITLDKFQNYIINKKYRPTKTSELQLYSNGSIEKFQHTLKSIFNFAKSRGFINTNPFDMSHVVKRRAYTETNLRKVVQPNHFNKFIDVINTVIDTEPENRLTAIIDKAFYLTVVWIGCRPGEAFALNVGDYDKETRYFKIESNFNSYDNVIVTTKTDEVRQAYAPQIVHDAIVNMLDEYPSEYIVNDAPLFGLVRRLSKTSLKNRRIKYCNAADIDLFSVQDLRHTNVSFLSHMGFEDIEISERTGHSVEVLNKYYKHVMPSKKKESNEKLDKIATLGQFLGNYAEKGLK